MVDSKCIASRDSSIWLSVHFGAPEDQGAVQIVGARSSKRRASTFLTKLPNPAQGK